MKYLIFFFVLFGVFPACGLLLFNRGFMKYALFGLILPIMFFQATSINFFSNELYRGTSRGMEISAIYLVAFTMLLAMMLLYRSKPFFPDRGSVLYLGYFLLCIPSLFHAENALFSWFELWKMIMMYLVFLAVYYYLYYYRDFDVIFLGFGIVAAGTFLAVVVQHVRGIHQASGFFPHQNSMGMFMNLIAPVFLSYYFNRGSGWKRFLFGGCFLLASAACLRTYSRGSMVGLPLGCAVTIFLSLCYRFHQRKVQALLPLGLLCLLGLLLLLPNIIRRFDEAPKESFETRRNLAYSAWNMMKDKPVLGVGLNNWGIKINPPYPYCEYRYSNKRIAPDFKEGIVESSYLLVGAECGLIALVAFLVWLGYYYIISWKLVLCFRNSKLLYIPVGIVGGLTAIYLQSWLEWVMKQQNNFIQMMILFAILSFLYKYRIYFASGRREVKA